jgi:hypothetical protein
MAHESVPAQIRNNNAVERKEGESLVVVRAIGLILKEVCAEAEARKWRAGIWRASKAHEGHPVEGQLRIENVAARMTKTKFNE